MRKFFFLLKLKKVFAKFFNRGKCYFLVNRYFMTILFKNIVQLVLKTRKRFKKRLNRNKWLKFFRKFFFNNNNLLNYEFLKNNLYFFFLKYSNFWMVSLTYYKVTDYHLEIIRRLARKLYGKFIFIKLLILAFFIILKRPNQMRMGGGKGSKFSKKIYFLYPGCRIIEFRGLNLINLYKFQNILKKKMPFLFKICLLDRI